MIEAKISFPRLLLMLLLPPLAITKMVYLASWFILACLCSLGVCFWTKTQTAFSKLQAILMVLQLRVKLLTYDISFNFWGVGGVLLCLHATRQYTCK